MTTRLPASPPFRSGLIVVGAVGAGALWWRRHPSACPYSQRFWVEAPHPIITRGRLRRVLRPRLGERILELGVGTGYYSLDLAEWVGGAGTVELFDLQQQMLDHVMERAGERGLANLVPTRGDASALPYADASMDAVVLTAVLGEIPDREAAMRQVARVLRPGGRLIVGELMGDPHYCSPGAVDGLARAAGLVPHGRSGSVLGYFAELRPNQEGSRPDDDDRQRIHHPSPAPADSGGRRPDPGPPRGLG